MHPSFLPAGNPLLKCRQQLCLFPLPVKRFPQSFANLKSAEFRRKRGKNSAQLCRLKYSPRFSQIKKKRRVSQREIKTQRNSAGHSALLCEKLFVTQRELSYSGFAQNLSGLWVHLGLLALVLGMTPLYSTGNNKLLLLSPPPST